MRFRSALFAATAAATLTVAGAAIAQDVAPLEVTLLAINDFHGNLKPPGGGIRIKDPADPAKTVNVPAGGSEAMATLVKGKRAAAKNSVFVAAGDLVGATPLLSALFADEPTIESLSLMGLELSAVGNHEFDKGATELLRKQNGGCGSDKSCLALHPFLGAKFQYLAASTIDTKTGKTLLPPYAIKTFEGISVGFIGLTLKGTPGIVLPSGVAGLEFKDEAETVNALVPELKKQGVEAIVVLIHEGGFPTGDYNECPGISGPIVDIVKKLDKSVDLVVSGHTHRAYKCVIDGRLVTSGDKFGTIVTQIDLKIDRKSRDLIEAKADNIIVRTDTFAKDPEQTALIAAYEKVAGPLIERPVGKLAASLTREETPAGESVLGDVVADAQWELTKAAEKGKAAFAVTNPGGIRADILKKSDESKVTYGEVFAAQPFGNNLVTLTLTGAEIDLMLEQQWIDQVKPRILQVSKNVSYTWDAAKPVGERVDIASITIDGKPIDPAASYRVTVNNFLADGGDGFKVIKKGRDQLPGIFDVDALEAYIAALGTIDATPRDRIKRVN
mgnify:CR=1 FL=1